MSGFIKTAAIAAFTAILGLGTVSHAATLPPVSGIVNLTSGQSVGGWKVYFPEGEGVALTQDVTDPKKLDLVLEKFADFNTTQSFLITFLKDAKSTVPAATSIIVANESITNSSGVDWTGFSFSLHTPFAPAATFAAGDAFIPGTGYSTVSTGSTAITYGGSQPDGTVSLWNQTPASNDLSHMLVINPNGSTNFSFKELPLVSVPVPAAAWTGLSGLLGLAAIAYGKNIKKILA